MFIRSALAFLLMSGRSISSVDEKGRVLVPQSIRDALNLRSGEKVVLELDSASKSVKIEPVHEKRLLHIAIHLADSPGSLAHAALALANLGVDLVNTRSHSSRRGEAAIWDVECNPGRTSLLEIRAALAKTGAKLLSSQWE